MLALLSGIAYALIFPKFNFYPLVFLWAVPLYVSISWVTSYKKAFRNGWIAGLTAFLILLYWIPITIRAGGGGWIEAILGWAALSAYLALYFGLFAFAAFYFLRRKSSWWQPFALAALWVGCEYLRAHALTGFPWCLLGYGVVPMTEILQWAEFGHIWILSFLPMLIAGFLFRKQRLMAVLILAAVWGAGTLRLEQIESRLKPSLTAALLQGNIDQYKKWNESSAQEIVSVYAELQKEALKENPDLVIWPESSWPYLEGKEAEGVMRLWGEVKSEALQVIGVIVQKENRIYNSALLAAKGKVLERYDKFHLVPFGEFVPFGAWLRKWIAVLNVLGETEAGTPPKALQTPQGSKIGITICYESIFPEIASALRKDGADLLINITNDGWYLDTAAPYQHLSMNVVRAVETRLPVLRAANTGISAYISPAGRVVRKSKLGERTFLIVEIKK